MHSAIVRVHQGLRALHAGFLPTAELPCKIATLLSERQRTAWEALPAIERNHLSRVGRLLLDRGESSPDLLIAAVFHDMGKHTATGSVRLLHRVMRVLLERLAPASIARLQVSPVAPKMIYPLWLSVHHARLGADAARELGCSPRTCWLIAQHEDAHLISDAELVSLRWADDRS